MPNSDKRIDANRANAAKSTGPRTPEGKSRSAQNARKHGFAAAPFTIARLEQPETLAQLRADAIAAYRPVNSQELIAAERIALAQLALFRCAALEAGLHTVCLNEVFNITQTPDKILCDDFIRGAQITTSQNRSFLLAIGFQHTVGKTESWKLFLRYQAQTERLFRRAVDEFERLKTLRDELPNEPIDPLDPDPLAPEEVLPQPPELKEYERAIRDAALADPEIELRPAYGTSAPPPKPAAPRAGI
jgi:hypothetical protein